MSDKGKTIEVKFKVREIPGAGCSDRCVGKTENFPCNLLPSCRRNAGFELVADNEGQPDAE